MSWCCRRYKINQRFIRESVIKVKITIYTIYNTNIYKYIQIYTDIYKFVISFAIRNQQWFPDNDKRKKEKNFEISYWICPTVDAPQTYGVLDNTFSRSSIAPTSAYVNTRLNSYHSADRKWIHSANSGHVLVWRSRFANGVGSTLSTTGNCRRRWTRIG